MRSSGAPRAVRRRIGQVGFARGRRACGKVEAGLAGHHDVQHQQVGLDGAEFVAGFGGVTGRAGDAEPLLGQIAGQQGTEAGVVVDDQDVGFRRVGAS